MKEKILDFLDPSRSVPLFIVGTAALTLALQALYDIANDPATWQGGYWLAIGALAVSAVILVISAIRRPAIGQVGIKEEHKPGKRAGLILLVGPTEAAVPHAIEYHLPVLQHCWLIATSESLKTAAIIAERYGNRVRVYHGSPGYLVDPDEMKSTYNMVVNILDQATAEARLSITDLIADMTGGLKPMTAGMALACLARNATMQYMKAPRDASGQVIAGAIPEPIRIDTTFIPTSGLPTA